MAVKPVDKATMPDPALATPVPILFLDIESTSLRVPWRSAPRVPWEIGAVRRETNGSEQEWTMFVRDVDLDEADPLSLTFGRFYDRHPQYAGGVTLSVEVQGRQHLYDEHEVAKHVEWLARGAHIVGAVPDFDVSTCDAMLARWGLAWPAHYHLVCAEVYAAGAVGWVPPYDSKMLSAALGVDPREFAAHEALEDARWARALYDAARTWTGGKIEQPRL